MTDFQNTKHPNHGLPTVWVNPQPATRNPTGLILEIQRMSTEDGPGLRTTVFFKGCPLRCTWCHNPESLARRPQVWWIASRCIGCASCREACPRGAVILDADGVHLDRRTCDACGACVEACPSTAMERLGTPWRLEDLTAELVKDRAFFEASGGGVTLSGGEPSAQAPFAAALLAALADEGLHTALDTCGLCAPDDLERLLPHAALVLFDLKASDPQEHRRFTGSDNALILANLARVAAWVRARRDACALWVRTPLVPEATATVANLTAVGRLIADIAGDVVQRWELCTFNHLCVDKYRRLGMDWPFAGNGLLERAQVEELTAVARAAGVDPGIVHCSGATRTAPDAPSTTGTATGSVPADTPAAGR